MQCMAQWQSTSLTLTGEPPLLVKVSCNEKCSSAYLKQALLLNVDASCPANCSSNPRIQSSTIQCAVVLAHSPKGHPVAAHYSRLTHDLHILGTSQDFAIAFCSW